MTLTSIYLVAAGMAIAGAWLYYLVVRDNAVKRPQGAVQWIAAGLSGLSVVLAVVLVVLAQQPPAPAPDVGPASISGAAEENLPRPSPDELNAPAANFPYRLVETDAEEELAAYEGKVVLLNFWATWCPPCLEEIPHLNRLQETYGDDGLVVLALSDEARADLRTSEIEAALETVSGYVDPEALPQPFQRTLEVRPTSYVIDREGRLREYLLGGRDYAAFEQAVLPYL